MSSLSVLKRTFIKGGVGSETGLTGKFAVVVRPGQQPFLIFETVDPQKRTDDPQRGIAFGVYARGHEVDYTRYMLASELEKNNAGRDVSIKALRELNRFIRRASQEKAPAMEMAA